MVDANNRLLQSAVELHLDKSCGCSLHLWMENTFKDIRDQCGGWLETDEETSLKNHLKWARLRVKGDGANIPREVKLSEKGLTFFIPIWPEPDLGDDRREEEDDG